MNALPKGTIIGWFDPIRLPKGWAKCDGNNGTPDLNERVPIGTINGKLGDEIGSNTHTHKVEGVTSDATFGAYNGQDNGPLQKLGDSRIFHHHNIDLVSKEGSSLPPSTKIFFIMKL